MIRLIATTEELKDFCLHIHSSIQESQNFITIDTEFQRERTYYPKLCLIQVATSAEVAVIDVLSPNLDLQPFYEILMMPGLMKVFHAGRQDLEIFYSITREIPAPLFDTQIAALVCGFGDSISYDALVQHYTHQKLDKSLQKTDWSRRPLSERHLKYAADDVLHLRRVYMVMRDYLVKTGRMEWIQDDMDVLLRKETYEPDPNQVWRRVKLRNPRPRTLVRLRALARVRERLARTKDLPRSRIVPDEILSELASSPPFEGAGVPPALAPRLKGLSHEVVEELVEAMEKALEEPPETWPVADHIPHRTLPAQQLAFMEYFLSLRAEQLRIVPRLLSTREELVRVVVDPEGVPPRFLSGWRYDIFGKDLMSLINGQSALKMEGRKISVIPCLVVEEKLEDPFSPNNSVIQEINQMPKEVLKS